mmetsp:Transcript_76974/g.193606  ORF Transcript_76974/g.193606 Transcript_76974/m.193606 type:complete len:323 (-) Transcript_76974:2083-3051(-)
MSLASRCLVCKKDLVSWMHTCASCCVVPAFSQAPFMASGAISASEVSASVASTACWTFCSAIETLASASRLTVAIFRSAIPFFVSDILLATASRRDCNVVSSSWVASADASDNRFAAKRFIAKKVLAPPTAVCAACTTESSSANNLLASSTGMSSTPLRKGCSATATLLTLSSASLTRSSDSFMIPSTIIFSDFSFIEAIISFSFSWASSILGFILAISSLARPDARVCESRNLPAVFSATWASAAALSAALAVFLPASLEEDASASSMLLTNSEAFSTFSSAALTLAAASSMTFLAANLPSTLPQSFLYLPTSACAVLSLV